MSCRPEIIISGGQSGADIAGIRAGNRLNIRTEINAFQAFKPVNMPRDRMQFAATKYTDVIYGLDYISSLIARTKYNVDHSDATLIIVRHGIELTRGSKLTRVDCVALDKPYMVQREADPNSSNEIFEFLKAHKPKVLNIAGERYCDEALVEDLLIRGIQGNDS